MRAPLLLLAGLMAAPLAAQADDVLTPSQIETLQHRGWITPAFESAARQAIGAKEQTARAQSDQTRLELQLPELQRTAATEDAKLKRLQDQLNHYAHPEETDYTALQQAMNRSTPAQDRLALAQAYVWTYPSSPHVADAQKDLQQLQKQIADQAQAASTAAAAQTASQAKLLQRVAARDLNLGEWRAFLQDKSQEEVIGYLGNPAGKDEDHWVYNGSWTTDPATSLKAGLSITFNGGRVQNVAPVQNIAGAGTSQ